MIYDSSVETSCMDMWLTMELELQVKVMVHERDQLMVKRLLECEGTVVGVVGMAHMDGIERLWKEAE